MHYLLDNDGPNFHEVISKPGSRKNLGRPTISPVDNKKSNELFKKIEYVRNCRHC